MVQQTMLQPKKPGQSNVTRTECESETEKETETKTKSPVISDSCVYLIYVPCMCDKLCAGGLVSDFVVCLSALAGILPPNRVVIT